MKRNSFILPASMIAVAAMGLLLPVASCAPRPGHGPATQAALEPIRYERTGGFAGTRDIVEITRTGEVVVAGKLLGEGKGQLKPEQIEQLKKLFADWKSLNPSYPNPPGAFDGFEVKIRYGTTEVAANQLNPMLPASFKAASAAIENIAREVAPRK